MAGTIDHANIVLKFDIKQTKALDLATVEYPIGLDWTTLLSTGTGANQASQVWTDTRTLSASATENLDLAGSLTNAFGETVTFTRVKVLAIKAASGNTNNVQVQRGSSNGVTLFLAASDGFELRPGAFALFVIPDSTAVAIAAGTSDILTITNSAGSTSVDYSILVVGTD